MARRAGMALWADLFTLGIDLCSVLDGNGPHSAAEALAVAEALPDTSRTAAALTGDAAVMGWGYDRELAVATYNLMIELYRTVPQWKKPPAVPHIDSPAEKARESRATEERRKRVRSNRGVMAMFGF